MWGHLSAGADGSQKKVAGVCEPPLWVLGRRLLTSARTATLSTSKSSFQSQDWVLYSSSQLEPLIILPPLSKFWDYRLPGNTSLLLEVCGSIEEFLFLRGPVHSIEGWSATAIYSQISKKRIVSGWSHVSVVKIGCYSQSRPEFGSQHPDQVTNNVCN